MHKSHNTWCTNNKVHATHGAYTKQGAQHMGPYNKVHITLHKTHGAHTKQVEQHMGPHSLLQFSHRCSKVFLILVKCPLTMILVCIALFIFHSHQNVKMTITNINLWISSATQDLCSSVPCASLPGLCRFFAELALRLPHHTHS